VTTIPSFETRRTRIGYRSTGCGEPRNAKASTGPRTAEGKAKSRLNALKLGLSTTDGIVDLPTESPEEFNAFRDAKLADLEPVGALEEQLATEVIELTWRLVRAAKIERGVLAHGVADADERFFTGRKRMYEITESDVSKAKMAELRIRDPEEVVAIAVSKGVYEHLEGTIEEARAPKRTDEGRLASGFIEDAARSNALDKLSRYETALFRRRNQALATLLALQAGRSEDTKKRR
jgi:hypothetical protein